MLVALAFLPLSKVTEGFHAVCRSVKENGLSTQLDGLLRYFSDTYVGKISFGGSET